MLRRHVILLAAALGSAVAACPPSSDCAVTLDCGPYQATSGAGHGGSGGEGGAPGENGEPCSAPADCVSELCVDEVCCASACDGICEACNLGDGMCAVVAAGTDPAGDCPGGTCDAAGACAQGDCLWNIDFGDFSNDRGFSVASDGAGAVYVGGRFGLSAGQTIDFGGDPLVCAGGPDIFVAKLEDGGARGWSLSFGDAEPQDMIELASDGADGVVLAGGFRGSVDFGDGALSSGDPNTRDIFVAKLDGDGACPWSFDYGDTANQQARAVCVTPAGDVAIAGDFLGSVDFGDGPRTAMGTDIFVARLTSDGAPVWSRHYGDSETQHAFAIAADPQDALIFGGSLDGTANFGGADLTSTMGSQDAFVVKLDANADHVWSHRYGDDATQFVAALAVAEDGSIAVAGDLDGNMDADGTVLMGMGGTDVFLMKLHADGSVDWAKSFGDAAYQNTNAVAVDTSGNIILAGRFAGMLDFGGGPLLNAGDTDGFLAKFAPDGTHLYSRRYGNNTDDDAVESVAVDPTGALFLTGVYQDEIDFGLGPLMAVGNDEGFVVKLAP